MDTKRLILFVIMSFSILLLWDSWQRHQLSQNPQDSTVVTRQDQSIPASSSINQNAQSIPNASTFSLDSGQRINVTTDLFNVSIDTIGGDIRHLELLKHRAADSNDKNFVLMDDTALPALYVAQTGLIGNDLPTHKSRFNADRSNYELVEGKETLEVKLSYTNQDVDVNKIYVFHRSSYVIDVRYEIHNKSSNVITPSVYYQIVHDNQSNQGTRMMPTFTGGAYFTNSDNYKKIKFADMSKADFTKTSTDGWIGLVQHYFVSAWIPADNLKREFYTKKLSDSIFSIGSVSELGAIQPSSTFNVSARLYTGPQTQSELKKTAKGLEYTVDYGWLTVIATPLFWILSAIHSIVNNWGVSIILLTFLIKLLFYPLSAASYRSMAQMREVAPRLQSLKDKFGDDKQKLQQAMMELYKTEKINPMGGCLPILVQIPVFISLYWMLLGTVEMRHAPFFGWIKDLSAIDPYYVLPILMGSTMIIQSKLNPKPADPVQAKVMMIMPVVFSVFFFFFPAGLVLYWLVNNILSIAQQWRINKVIHKENLAKKKGNVSR